MNRASLTERQAEAYRLIVEGESSGLSPRLRDIGEAMSITKVCARELVEQLVLKGYVTRRDRKARGLSAVEPVDGRYVAMAGDAADLAAALRGVLMLPVDGGMKAMVIREDHAVLKRAHAALAAYDGRGSDPGSAAGSAKPRAAGCAEDRSIEELLTLIEGLLSLPLSAETVAGLRQTHGELLDRALAVFSAGGKRGAA